MAESARRWTDLRAWAGDIAFVTVVGACLGAIGPYGTFVQADLGFRLVYWIGLFWIGIVIFGPAIRAAAMLDGRWRVPGALWLLGFTIAGCAPMSWISAVIAVRVWPMLAVKTPLDWYGQSLAVAAPLALTYGVLTRRLAPFGRRPQAADAAGPARLARLPDRLARGLVCLQMEDHYVRAHSRGGSELVLLSMREATAGLGEAAGRRVHRSWWVAREAVTGVVADGRNLRLRLVNGLEVPVSRSQVGALRAAGWFDDSGR